MVKKYCAYCGAELDEHDEAYVVGDNYLEALYFDNLKDNRFCSKQCLCNALSVICMPVNELPVDDDEEETQYDDSVDN